MTSDSHWDVGAAIFLSSAILGPLAAARARRIRLRHGVALWLVGWGVGLAAWMGERWTKRR